MKSQLNNSVTSSRPKDKSIEAYKTWMLELAQRFTNEKTIELSEADWVASWKAYWKDKSGRERLSGLHAR